MPVFFCEHKRITYALNINLGRIAYDIYEKLNNLTILLKLNANQKQLLYQNIFDTLMGVIDINNFKNALISQLQLPTNLADFAFQEINRILFLPLGPSIQRMRDYVQTGL